MIAFLLLSAAVPPQPPAAADRRAAAAVVARFFADLGAHHAPSAWRAWDRGRADPAARAALQARLSRYAHVAAAVGTPGRVDAGAGQRYITVPLTLAATGRGPRRVRLRGEAVLHRTGAIDGATADQRRWRITAITLKAAPGPWPR